MATTDPLYDTAPMARLLNISPRRLQQLANEGVVHRGSRGKYRLVASVTGYIKYLQERAAGKDMHYGQLQEERTRLVRSQADAQELKNSVYRHEVVPIDFITFLLARTANEIAGILDSLPAELVRRMGLVAEQAEQVKAQVSRAGDNIANLGDAGFIESVLDEFISKTDNKL